MATTVQQVQEQSEVWQNTAVGNRWFKCLDLQGREISKVVQGGRTFTITTFERQLNQQVAASPQQDLFRNGTFVLKKPAKDTVQDEVLSPNSMTDTEIASTVNELMYGDWGPDNVLQHIDSKVTLNRILEQLVLEDASKSLIDFVKEKMVGEAPKAVEPSKPVVTQPDFDTVKAAVVITPDPVKDKSEG